jgi:ribosome-binding protein aMBF1 (putative translation factor)
MSVLEIVASKQLGSRALSDRPRLRSALSRLEHRAQHGAIPEGEKERITSIVELCFEYERTESIDEKRRILDAIEEIARNEPILAPTETVDDWEQSLGAAPSYRNAKTVVDSRTKDFLKRYASLKAKAGLQTQQAVANKANLSRSHVAMLEQGEHFPQQRTLQKLARAFGVDIIELMPD